MASRANLGGRKGGYGRGILSKVYGAAQKKAKANRRAGAPPGAPPVDRSKALGETKEGHARRMAASPAGAPDTIAAQQEALQRSPFEKIKAAAKNRGGLRGMAEGARKMAPGLDQLTGGGEPIVARQPPPTPPVAMNPLPPAHAPVQRGMGAAGSARLASMGVNTRPSPAAIGGPPAKPILNPSAMTGGPTPAPVVTPEVTENIAVPETAALAPGQGSVRSQGMHRSSGRIGSGSGGIRRRAKEDRG